MSPSDNSMLTGPLVFGALLSVARLPIQPFWKPNVRSPASTTKPIPKAIFFEINIVSLNWKVRAQAGRHVAL